MVGVAGFEPDQFPLFKGKIECCAQKVRKHQNVTHIFRSVPDMKICGGAITDGRY